MSGTTWRATLSAPDGDDLIRAGTGRDTTAGGKSRLDWALAEDPQAAIVALGGMAGDKPLKTFIAALIGLFLSAVGIAIGWAGGFAAGTVLGITLERWIASGFVLASELGDDWRSRFHELDDVPAAQD